jgi:DNA-binding transcriptional MocR family regulator
MSGPEDFVNPAYRSIGESLVRELARLMSDPEMISLAGGYPGPDLFDREGIRASVDEALAQAPVAALQYGPTDGLLALREAICEWMMECGTPSRALIYSSGRCCGRATVQLPNGPPIPGRCGY